MARSDLGRSAASFQYIITLDRTVSFYSMRSEMGMTAKTYDDPQDMRCDRS